MLTFRFLHSGDVARNGGSIFDSCWRADDTILARKSSMATQIFASLSTGREQIVADVA